MYCTAVHEIHCKGILIPEPTAMIQKYMPCWVNHQHADADACKNKWPHARKSFVVPRSGGKCQQQIPKENKISTKGQMMRHFPRPVSSPGTRRPEGGDK